MKEEFSRTALAFKEEGLEKLKNTHVAVFGLGGVGSYVVEALCRSGVGTITLIDSDEYSLSNINRQLYATKTTVGEKKTEVCRRRILEINENCKVETYDLFVLPENISKIDFTKFNYVIDAIDTVSGKLAIIEECNLRGVKVISAMGAGNKVDPTAFRVADIYKTKVCPLAKSMRKLLKERGIKSLKCVYSQEIPLSTENNPVEGGRVLPSSNSFTPSVMGLILAGEVIKDICGFYGNGIDKS